MSEERFRGAAVGITDSDRLLIDQLWAAVGRRNRWRLRMWRLVNAARAIIAARQRRRRR